MINGHGSGQRSEKSGPKPRHKRNLPEIYVRVMAILEQRGCPRHDPVHFEQFIAYQVSNESRETIPDRAIEAWAKSFERELTNLRKPHRKGE